MLTANVTANIASCDPWSLPQAAQMLTASKQATQHQVRAISTALQQLAWGRDGGGGFESDVTTAPPEAGSKHARCAAPKLLHVHGGQAHLHTSSMLWASSKMRTASFRSTSMAWRMTGSCRVKAPLTALEESWELVHVKYHPMPSRLASDRGSCSGADTDWQPCVALQPRQGWPWVTTEQQRAHQKVCVRTEDELSAFCIWACGCQTGHALHFCYYQQQRQCRCCWHCGGPIEAACCAGCSMTPVHCLSSPAKWRAAK